MALAKIFKWILTYFYSELAEYICMEKWENLYFKAWTEVFYIHYSHFDLYADMLWNKTS